MNLMMRVASVNERKDCKAYAPAATMLSARTFSMRLKQSCLAKVWFEQPCIYFVELCFPQPSSSAVCRWSKALAA